MLGCPEIPEENTPMPSRIYRVTRKVEETPNTTSVYLAAVDDQPLQPFRGGQLLRFDIPDVGERAYVLSAFSTKPNAYRITVKHRAGDDNARSGAGYWRAIARQGDLVRACGPTGSFHLPETLDGPVVIITAGAGEASLTAIAEELAVRAARHPVWFLHRTVNGATFALKDKLGSLRADLPSAKWWIWYSHPCPTDRKDRQYQYQGEIDLSDLGHPLPGDGCDFHVCGPDGFVARIVEELRRRNVAAERIHVQCVGAEEEPSTALDEAEFNIPELGPTDPLRSFRHIRALEARGRFAARFRRTARTAGGILLPDRDVRDMRAASGFRERRADRRDNCQARPRLSAAVLQRAVIRHGNRSLELFGS
jgi:ferredoxin-NADP reductase